MPRNVFLMFFLMFFFVSAQAVVECDLDKILNAQKNGTAQSFDFIESVSRENSIHIENHVKLRKKYLKNGVQTQIILNKLNSADTDCTYSENQKSKLENLILKYQSDLDLQSKSYCQQILTQTKKVSVDSDCNQLKNEELAQNAFEACSLGDKNYYPELCKCYVTDSKNNCFQQFSELERLKSRVESMPDAAMCTAKTTDVKSESFFETKNFKTILDVTLTLATGILAYKTIQIIQKQSKKNAEKNSLRKAPAVTTGSPVVANSKNPYQGHYECMLGKPDVIDTSLFPAGTAGDLNIHLGGIITFDVNDKMEISGSTTLHGNTFPVGGSMSSSGSISLIFSNAGVPMGNFQYNKDSNHMTGYVYEAGKAWVQGKCFNGTKTN